MPLIENELIAGLAYVAAWPVAAALGSAASLGTLVAASEAGVRWAPAWVAWALNLLPALAVGFGVGVLVAARLAGRRRRRRRAAASGPSGGGAVAAARAAPLIALVLAPLGAVVASQCSHREFGLWAQLVVWPAAAAVGELAAVTVAAALERPRARTA